MKYLKKYNENFQELKFLNKKTLELREDSIAIGIDGSDVGYDFLLKKDDDNIEVIYDYEPDSFIENIGINEDGSLKDSKLKKWLVSLTNESIGSKMTINNTSLVVNNFENIELLKKGILKISYNGKILTFVIEEGDLEKEDYIDFNSIEDKINASKVGLELSDEIKEKLLELYY